MKNVTVKELFKGPVKEWALYDNVRSLPSMVDGFKVTQRKAIFGATKKTGVPPTGIKVAQLTAHCAEVSAYHHGEGSMAGAITDMAKDFAGSNNINWFLPIGQFGSRISPSAGAARYIFTMLSPTFRKIFMKEDDGILEHLEDDGDVIEPKYYLPIIPTVLVNGQDGMGTGYAMKFLSYNPEDLRKHCLAILKGKKPSNLTPWYRGYNGSIEKNFENGQTTFKGSFKRVNTTTIDIEEIPLWISEEKYREKTLIKLEDSGIIKSFDSLSTADRLVFRLNVPRTTTAKTDEELMVLFKLVSRESENLTCWTPEGKICRFASPEALVKDFVEFRLDVYEKRKAHLLKVWSEELAGMEVRSRFIQVYLDNKEKFSALTKAKLVEWLAGDCGFGDDAESLLNIRLYRLTADEIEKLKDQVSELRDRIAALHATTAEQLYIKDLEALDLKEYRR